MGYPIHLVTLEGERALLAGAGPVAAEKVVPLIHAGAKVHLVAPEVSREMEPWLSRIWRVERRPALHPKMSLTRSNTDFSPPSRSVCCTSAGSTRRSSSIALR